VFERLAALVIDKMNEDRVPGVSLGILRDGMITTRGFGVTNVNHPLPVTDRTLFQIGSISKTFTGTAMMRLVDEGKVRLEAPVRSYLPEFAVGDQIVSRDVTVLDLLTHMGGWEGDVFEDTGDGADAVARYVGNLKNVEQVAPLRSFWSYNNSGFIIAARIIEVVTGKTYDDALRDLVITPLALQDTFVRPADVMTMRFSVGHLGGLTGPQVARPWAVGRYLHAAGGVVSTPRDLLRYAQFHMGDGAPLFSSDTLRRMHATVLTKHGMDEEMAVTWNVTTAGGVRRVSHGGGTLGQQSNLVLVPEHRFAVAVVLNGGGSLGQDLVRAALKEYLGLDSRDPVPSPVQPELSAFLGGYSRPFADVLVSAENGAMLVQVIRKRDGPGGGAGTGPKVPHVFFAKDSAVATVAKSGPQTGARIQFLRDANGEVAWVRVGNRVARKTAVNPSPLR
jgi:CubicO group peptidase (beta-lactamase class C family)